MNTLQIIESVQQVFPRVSRNQIRLDVDTAQKLLADETGIITTRGSLTSPTTNFAWALPTGFLRLKDFAMYDANDNPVYPEGLNYKYEVEFDKFYVYDEDNTPITGLDCVTAYIHYVGLPSTLTTESTSMEITDHYRDAIESYVLAKYFAKFPIPFISGGNVVEALNLQAAQYQKLNYEQMRVKIKRLFNSRDMTNDHWQMYPDAGKYYLPERPNDTSSSTTVSIAALTDLYTKYAYFKMTPADDGTSVDPTIELGYSTISSALSGDTVTLTSTAEFDEEGIINVNNWDATWVMNSSSEIVFTLPSGWTTFSFEIFERS